MSSHGYIYVRNWDKFQHYKHRRPAWIKLYLDLLERDEYRALTLADRGLLQDLWKLVGMLGDGRLSADRVSLARRLNVRRVSLEPLISAGFIEVRASKALAEVLAPELEVEKEKDLTPPLVEAPRLKEVPKTGGEKKKKDERQARDLMPYLMRERWVSERVLLLFQVSDLPLLVASFEAANDLRDYGKQIEEAGNPRAYAMGIATRTAPTADVARWEQKLSVNHAIGAA